MGRIKNIITLTGLVTIISGCATPVITAKEVEEKYKGASIIEFLKGQYLRKAYESTGLLNGDHIGFVAPFTPMNTDYLYRPYNEIKTFCEVNKGEFNQAVLYSGNPIRPLLKNPYEDSLKKYHLAKKLGFNEYASNIVKENQMNKSSQYNSYVSGETGFKGMSDGNTLKKAILKDKIFGSFTCSVNGEQAWAVNMIPVKFDPRSPTNQLLTARLYISVGVL